MRCLAWLRRRYRVDHEESLRALEQACAQRHQVEEVAASLRAHQAKNGFGEAITLAFERRRQ